MKTFWESNVTSKRLVFIYFARYLHIHTFYNPSIDAQCHHHTNWIQSTNVCKGRLDMFDICRDILRNKEIAVNTLTFWSWIVVYHFITPGVTASTFWDNTSMIIRAYFLCLLSPQTTSRYIPIHLIVVENTPSWLRIDYSFDCFPIQGCSFFTLITWIYRPFPDIRTGLTLCGGMKSPCLSF